MIELKIVRMDFDDLLALLNKHNFGIPKSTATVMKIKEVALN